MKILITGGSGMVGKSLKNHINYFFSSNQNKYYFLSSKLCNLLNYEESYKIFESIDPEIVIHLAADVGGLYKNLNNNIKMFQDNLQMNINVFKISNELNVKKLISIGSTCIFPDKTSYPLKETMLHRGIPHKSNYGYSFAKRMLDVMTTLYNTHSNMKCIYLIPCNLYGKFDNFNLENSHVIPALIHKFYLAKINNKPMYVKGSGKAKRQFLFVDDFCEVICRCIFNDIKYTTMIVCPNKEYTIKEVVNKISMHLNFKNEIIYIKKYSDGQLKKTSSNKILKKQFQDIKFTKFDIGIKDTIDWFIKNYKNIRK